MYVNSFIHILYAQHDVSTRTSIHLFVVVRAILAEFTVMSQIPEKRRGKISRMFISKKMSNSFIQRYSDLLLVRPPNPQRRGAEFDLALLHFWDLATSQHPIILAFWVSQ